MQELSARVETPPVIEFIGPRERLEAELEKLHRAKNGKLSADGDPGNRS